MPWSSIEPLFLDCNKKPACFCCIHFFCMNHNEPFRPLLLLLTERPTTFPSTGKTYIDQNGLSSSTNMDRATHCKTICFFDLIDVTFLLLSTWKCEHSSGVGSETLSLLIEEIQFSFIGELQKGQSSHNYHPFGQTPEHLWLNKLFEKHVDDWSTITSLAVAG